MTMSPCCIWPATSRTVASTAAAGTINQTARGGFSLAMKSSSEAAPVAPLLAKSLTLSGFMSKTTHSWPPCNRRLTILAPILPRPIIPSCIFALLPSIMTPHGLSCCRSHAVGRASALADHPLVPDVKPEQVLNQIALLTAQQALPHCWCCDDRHIVQGCESPIVIACARDWQPRTKRPPAKSYEIRRTGIRSEEHTSEIQ